MMEQADMGHGHSDAIFITGLNDIVITDGTAALSDKGYAAFMGSFDIITKGEEGIGTKRYIDGGAEPGLFFFAGEYGRFFCEYAFPVIRTQKIHALIGDIDINSVISIRAADICFEGQSQDLRALAQIPDIGFVTGKARAMDTGLLSGTDADGLAVFGIADGIRLGVFQCNEGD